MSVILTVTDVHRGDIKIDTAADGTLYLDVDGTIADLKHRRQYVATKPKNWPAFERTMHLDPPIQHVIDWAMTLKKAGWTVVIMTGRGAQNKQITEDWLKEHGVEYDAIYTRALKDYRKDSIVKAELMDQAVEDGYTPTMVFDDRNQVVEMWRARGVFCVQVAEGDF